MPVIKSAKKKLRQDKKKRVINTNAREGLKEAIKRARKTPSVENIQQAVILADKAAKNRLIHKNNAAHIKSALSKLVKGPAKSTGDKAKIAKKSSSKKTAAQVTA